MKKNKNIRIGKDGYAFYILGEESARAHFCDNDDMVVLHDDGSDTMIETNEQLTEAISRGEDIGLELGFIPKTLIPMPVDDKHVMTDWIDDVFDGHYSQRCNGKHGNFIIGIYKDRPTLATISGNAITWQILGCHQTMHAELCDDIQSIGLEGNGLKIEYEIKDDRLVQKFYLTEEGLIKRAKL